MSKKESKWQEYKKSLGDSRPWHLLLKENYVSSKIAEERFFTCLQCPFLTRLTHQCVKCKCLMRNKTRLKQAECPLGKWGKELD